MVRGSMPLNPPDARLGVGSDGKSYVEGSTYTWADLTYAESRAHMLELYRANSLNELIELQQRRYAARYSPLVLTTVHHNAR